MHAAAQWILEEEVEAMASLVTPVLVLREGVARRNAKKMLDTAARLGVALRPHVKTHKSVFAAMLQTGGRKAGIVVSTLAEAEAFAAEGFDDIVYAVPMIEAKVPRARELHERVKLTLVLDTVETARILQAAPAQRPWNVQVMVDCGYGRDGVDPRGEAAVELVRELEASAATRFTGLYTHGGHSYTTAGRDAVVAVAEQERDAVVGLARTLKERLGVDCESVSVGSTPTCANPAPHLEGVTEMHAGNYLAFDMMQTSFGSCAPEDIAMVVRTSVIGHKHNRILVDMGWSAYSKQGSDSPDLFGQVLGHPELRVVELKQECGLLGPAPGADPGQETQLDLGAFPVGSTLEVIPFHACATAAMHRRMWLSDEQRFETIHSGLW